MATVHRPLASVVFCSLYAQPLLWVAAGLTWLVPMLSPYAAGHHLYVVVLVGWPGLLLLALGSVAVLVLARRRNLRLLGPGRLGTLAALQGLLLAMIVIGSVPVLTFNLHPETSIEDTGIHQPFALVSAIVIAVECLLLRRKNDSAANQPANPNDEQRRTA